MQVRIKVDSALSQVISCELMSEPLFTAQTSWTDLMDLTLAANHSAATSAATSAEAELETAIAELRFGDFHQRWDAAKRLPGLGDQVILPLLQLILAADDDWELLWFVARILGNLQHPSAVAALVKLLESSPDPEVTAMAATALINFGELALPALIPLLRQPSTRLIALRALAQIQHPDVLPLLLDVATDRAGHSADVQAAAILALSQVQLPVPLSGQRSVQRAQITPIWDLFKAGLQDSAAVVRRAVVTAVGARADQFGRLLGSEALVEAISPLLDDSDLEVGRQAALALGRVGSEAAVGRLGSVLQGQMPISLKIAVLRALAWTERPAALAQIRQYLSLRHPITALDQEIVAVLGRVTVCRAIATSILLDLFASAHPIAETVTGKQQIALSLGQLQQAEAIDALIDLLTDSLSVRLHATAALKQLVAQGAVARMQQRLEHSDSSAGLKQGLSLALQELVQVNRAAQPG